MFQITMGVPENGELLDGAKEESPGRKRYKERTAIIQEARKGHESFSTRSELSRPEIS